MNNQREGNWCNKEKREGMKRKTTTIRFCVFSADTYFDMVGCKALNQTSLFLPLNVCNLYTFLIVLHKKKSFQNVKLVSFS